MKLNKFFSGPSAISGEGANVDVAPRWIGEKAEVQQKPHEFSTGSGQTHRVFIDTVVRVDGKVVILGWSTSPRIELILKQDTQSRPLEVQRHARGDVADALQLSSGDNVGFSVVADAPVATGKLELEIRIPGCRPYRTGPVAEKAALTDIERALLPELLNDALSKLQQEPMGSDAWFQLVETLPEAKKVPPGYHGFLEGIFVSPEGNGVVFGWALHPENAIIWLEDDSMNIYPLDRAFRRERRDIASAFSDVSWRDMEAAFIAHIPKMDANPLIRLRVVTPLGVTTLNERAGAEMLSPDPRDAAEKLFAIETEERLFYRRAPLVDWPILKPLIERRQVENSKLTPRVKDFGKLSETPEFSLIIPLYKRFDFMEHQFLEFVREPMFADRVELIYVIDDANISNDVLSESDRLYRLFDLPFRVVSGVRNRGFSGANNLGAAYANGEHLVFMNSDVIPIEPGWLDELARALDDSEVGMVGARLLFPDGGLQHAGMEFEYLDKYSIWSNQHPGTGLSPKLDCNKSRRVPAVTGACLMIPRQIFDEVKGWDTGYLLGDFEDSDLCFAVRKAGYGIVYQPSAELTHLERQSFIGVGGDNFRIRMTICNSMRHQERWEDFLSEVPSVSLNSSTFPMHVKLD